MENDPQRWKEHILGFIDQHCGAEVRTDLLQEEHFDQVREYIYSNPQPDPKQNLKSIVM